jgi:AcrR family transcriptional regulator
LLEFRQAARVQQRRRPVQERARRRREEILDATAQILESQGWDALNTNAVARQAQISIGTVYDYFPNREALLLALLERYEERLAAAMDEALALADPLAAASAAVDVLARFWASEPGYRVAWLGTRMTDLLDRTGARWSDRFTERVAVTLHALAPQRDAAELRIIARTAVHLVSGLLLAAVTSEDREALVAEARAALLAYLSARLLVTS